MRKHRKAWRVPALSVLFASAIMTLGLVSVTGAAAQAASTGVVPISPNAVGEIDCNGLSPIQHPVKSDAVCADISGSWNGRFYENGRYIGHDEPSIRFISNQPGSGDNTTFVERLPVDPKALPTVKNPGHDVTHTFELTIAPWFSTDVCDPQSAPQNPCTPESDANAPNSAHGFAGAGAAFVELQFYPPGFAPETDNISCDNTHWCSALNIDSLECFGSGFATTGCNNNCTEPVNFAFVQTNGAPTGPPSPQESDNATFTPNRHTLLMNPGDLITVHMFDAKIPGGHALEAQETDLTTGKSGFMIASAANGFMNTNVNTCDGTPFNFQPEYSSAAAPNVIPWGFGPYMINSEFEVGHFEPCTSLTGKVTSTGDTYYTNCEGPYETTAENPNLEPDDSPCYPFGDTHHGKAAPNLVTGCDVFFDAIGDLDYDGTPYYPDWPNSVRPDRFPSTFQQFQPFTVHGQRYPQIQFVTDNSATQFETNCDVITGENCVLPPPGPGNFYPYWTLARVGYACVWEFGNMRNGNTFGGDAQYGSVGQGTLGAFASAIQPNPAC